MLWNNSRRIFLEGYGELPYYACHYDNGDVDDLYEPLFNACTKLYIKEQEKDPIHALKQPATSTEPVMPAKRKRKRKKRRKKGTASS